MKLIQKIDLFKIAIVVILSVFLYLFSQYSKNGRYEYTGDNSIIDTRTGYTLPLEYRYDRYPNYGNPVFPLDYNKLTK